MLLYQDATDAMFAQRRSTPGHGWLSPTLPSGKKFSSERKEITEKRMTYVKMGLKNYKNRLSYSLLLLFVSVVICQEDDIPEFELLGAKQPEKGIEFSFEIPARRRECFYQYLPHGSQMKFSFKVIPA